MAQRFHLRGLAVACATLLTATIVVAVGSPAAAHDPAPDDCAVLISWSGNDADLESTYVSLSDGTGRTPVSAQNPQPSPTDNSAGVFSPDGSKIAWKGYEGGVGKIFVANSDGSDRVAASTTDNSTPAPTSAKTPIWSPDGMRIAFQGHDGSFVQHIYTMNPDGSNRIKVSDIDGSPDPTGNFGQTWSPDGSKIAWEGTVAAANHVFVANADGTNRIDVTLGDANPPDTGKSPSWSPSGDRLAWYGEPNGGGDTEIWISRPDGSNRTMLNAGLAGGKIVPQWSPTSDLIAFRSGGQLYTSAPDGSGRSNLSTTGGPPLNSAIGGRWSPLGDHYTWVDRKADNIKHIYVAHPDGSGRVEIDVVEGPADWKYLDRPSFSRDGSLVGWTGDETDFDQRGGWVANLDGSGLLEFSAVGADPDPISSGTFGWGPSCPEPLPEPEPTQPAVELIGVCRYNESVGEYLIVLIGPDSREAGDLDPVGGQCPAPEPEPTATADPGPTSVPRPKATADPKKTSPPPKTASPKFTG